MKKKIICLLAIAVIVVGVIIVFSRHGTEELLEEDE